MHEADGRPNLARKLCVCVLNSRTVTQKFQPVFTEIFRVTPYMFLHIKRQINNQRIVCYCQKSANQTANGCFCYKIRSTIWGLSGIQSNYAKTPYGDIRNTSKQLHAPYGVSRAQWVKLSSRSDEFSELKLKSNSHESPSIKSHLSK